MPTYKHQNSRHNSNIITTSHNRRTSQLYINTRATVFTVTNKNKHWLHLLHKYRPNLQYLHVRHVCNLYIPSLSLKHIVHLDINGTELCTLPNDLPQTIQTLYCCNNCLKALPDRLPSNLILLHCDDNKLTYLPKNLPNTLYELKVQNNLITHLPVCMQYNLHVLWCSRNKITMLTSALPAKLEILSLYENHITYIANGVLPNTLTTLDLSYNNLSKLPDTLPPNIKRFEFMGNINLHVLPDLPAAWGNILGELSRSITFSSSYSSQFEKNYPNIKYWQRLSQPLSRLIKSPYVKKYIITDYINECNSRRRTCERTAIINANGALWEAYMRRAMHPARFGAALLADPDLDIEEYTASYVAAL